MAAAAVKAFTASIVAVADALVATLGGAMIGAAASTPFGPVTAFGADGAAAELPSAGV